MKSLSFILKVQASPALPPHRLQSKSVTRPGCDFRGCSACQRKGLSTHVGHASPLEAHLLPCLIRCDALRSLYDATGYKAAVRNYRGCADEAHGYSVAPVEGVLSVSSSAVT